ncbi:MAG TPA: rhomboid family intramembrane serine protease [Burkholderiales bacterium]|nr:rhomboid family intramembrane serine protease [Burkholderiales bacterium]
MLLPLHDENPLKRIRFGYCTVALIVACVLVFLYQMSLAPEEGARFVFAYGAIPSVVFGSKALPAEVARIPAELTLLTSMFLHGGLMHLVGNMLFLWVLGDNVEDALGHLRFVLFYLLSGVSAALAHALTEPGSTVPMIGASGAISGVIGAYLMLHPRAPIRTLVVRVVVVLPAYVVLGLWIGFQFVNAWLAGAAGAGVAWWAHIGGFFAGAVLIVPMRQRGVPLFDRPDRGS